MSSVSYVKAKALRIDSMNFATCPRDENIPCENTIVQGLAWGVPIVSNGLLVDYDWQLGTDKPTTDSVHAIRLYNKDSRITYFAAITDGATESVWVDRCNACCGATPEMPAVTVPTALVCTEVCADADGNYIFDFPLPVNPIPLELIVSNGTFNDAAATALSPDTFANAAALLAGVQADWVAYGTWSLEATNTILRLTSTTTKCAGLDINLVAVEYCMLYPEAATNVNGITIGGSDFLFPGGTIAISDDSAAVRNSLVDALNGMLIGTFSIAEDGGNPGDWYLHYTGLQEPEILQMDGVDVANTDFANANCP